MADRTVLPCCHAIADCVATRGVVVEASYCHTAHKVARRLLILPCGGWRFGRAWRTLLEIHYDTLHLERHLALGKGQKKRTSEYKVFTTVAQSYRMKLCQRVELPESIKSIFRCPAHEDDWKKLEEARLAIVRCIQGEKDLVEIDEAEALELVSALERSSSVHPDELVGHEMYPDGSRLVVESPPGDLSVAQQRAMVCDAVAKSVGRTLTVRTRPLSMNPPLDSFAKAIVDPSLTVRAIAASAKFQRPSKEALLDRLLLVLYDSIFLDACLTWTAKKVSNLHCAETPQLARYFLKGLSVGDAPIFRGLCAFCARLLSGPTDRIVGSKVGPPIDRHGKRLVDARGRPLTSAQPPCLLRYSPSMFAQEAPSTFAYDPATNRLTLRPGQSAPWLRGHVPHGDPNVWLYCADCYTQWIGPVDRRKSASGVPFRDKASQQIMRPTWRSAQRMEEAAAASSAPVADFDFDGQREGEDYDGLDGDVPDDIPCAAAEDVGIVAEPESEPDIESAARDDAAEPDVDVEADDADGGTAENAAGLPVGALRDVVPALIPEVRPTLEQYMEKWARLLAQHSKKVPGKFSNNNLVPTPIDALWQARSDVLACSGQIVAHC